MVGIAEGEFLAELAAHTVNLITKYAKEGGAQSQAGVVGAPLMVPGRRVKKILREIYQVCSRKFRSEGYPCPELEFYTPESRTERGSFRSDRFVLSMADPKGREKGKEGAQKGIFVNEVGVRASVLVHELGHYLFDMLIVQDQIARHPGESDEEILDRLCYTRDDRMGADMIVAARRRVEGGVVSPEELAQGRRYYEETWAAGKKVLPRVKEAPGDLTREERGKLVENDPRLAVKREHRRSEMYYADSIRRINKFNEKPPSRFTPGKLVSLAGMDAVQCGAMKREIKRVEKSARALERSKWLEGDDADPARVKFLEAYREAIQAEHVIRRNNYDLGFRNYIWKIPTENFAHSVQTVFQRCLKERMGVAANVEELMPFKAPDPVLWTAERLRSYWNNEEVDPAERITTGEPMVPNPSLQGMVDHIRKEQLKRAAAAKVRLSAADGGTLTRGARLDRVQAVVRNGLGVETNEQQVLATRIRPSSPPAEPLQERHRATHADGCRRRF